MFERTEVNVSTGKVSKISLTQQEIEAGQSYNPPKHPNPKGFYEKMIGMHGDTYPLHLVYKSITTTALDPLKDSSSLDYAVIVYNNSLNINDWSLPQSKEAYLSAYDILKRFLTVGQISIIDAENINFNLV